MVKVWLCIILAVSLGVCRGDEEGLNRDDFPKDFVFGSASSAYQVEGAVAEDGRSPSIWDTFAHSGKSTGDIAVDGYHKYKDDIKLMEDAGLEGYRFSISWSRILPNGRGYVNPAGIKYYNSLINELIKKRIQPHVTLFHYDLPQVLEDEYQGWLNAKIVEDFTVYADVCFREFGDRVSHWTTLNEPNVFILGGYDSGTLPPGRCSYSPFDNNCSHGDSVREPYIAAHNCLLAHSSVVSLYRRKYQAVQKGSVGLNIYMNNLVPISASKEDIVATKRAQEFYTGWFIQPLMSGSYPDTMKKIIGKKLPKFSKKQSEQLTGAVDFIGLNYYDTYFVKDNPTDKPEEQRDYGTDMSVKISALSSEDSYGLQGVLEYLKQSYDNPLVYIHENGFEMPHSNNLDDTPRVKYLSAHIKSLHNALRNGSNTVGYFTWSFLDLFELKGGYKNSYGLYYVDFDDKQLKRYPKLSAHWYSNFLKRRSNTNVIHEDISMYAPYI